MRRRIAARLHSDSHDDRRWNSRTDDKNCREEMRLPKSASDRSGEGNNHQTGAVKSVRQRHSIYGICQ